MKTFIVLLVCLLLNCGCVKSDTDQREMSDKNSSDPLSGEWVFSILTYGVNDIEEELKTKAVFSKTKDGKYVGTWETLPPEYREELKITNETEMPKYELENIMLDDNKLTFEYLGYKKVRSKFSGTLEGNTITGMYKMILGDLETSFMDRTITGTRVK